MTCACWTFDIIILTAQRREANNHVTHKAISPPRLGHFLVLLERPPPGYSNNNSYDSLPLFLHVFRILECLQRLLGLSPSDGWRKREREEGHTGVEERRDEGDGGSECKVKQGVEGNCSISGNTVVHTTSAKASVTKGPPYYKPQTPSHLFFFPLRSIAHGRKRSYLSPVSIWQP